MALASAHKQFSLRALFVFVTLTCTGAASIVKLRDAQNRSRDVVDSLCEVGVFRDSDAFHDPWLWNLRYALNGFREAPILKRYIALGKFEDKHAPLFLECKGLRYLYLWSPHITDSTLQVLKEVQGLQVLDLRGSQVSSDGVALLQDHRSLCVLRLENNRINDNAFRFICRMPHLERLSLTESDITGRGLADLRKCKSLWFLCLDGTGVTDSDVSHLGLCATLTELELRHTCVTGSAFRGNGFESLEVLRLSCSMANDEGLRHISALPSLRQLSVDGTRVTDRGLNCLLDNPSLSRVSVRDTDVSSELARSYSKYLEDRDYLSAVSRRESHKESVREFRRKMKLLAPADDA